MEMINTPEGLRVSKYPVTVEQWCAVMGGSAGDRAHAAASGMTQAQAIEFCRRLNEAEGRTGEDAYRLPTVEEWVYAAHAGSSTLFGIYGGDLSDYAWYGRPNHQKGPPLVGHKQPNAWGLHDVWGCVQEMTINVSLGCVLLRGGSFRSTKLDCSVGKAMDKKSSQDDVGFRVVSGVRTPLPPEKEQHAAFGLKDWTDLEGW